MILEITYDQMKIYIAICTLISICIYTVLSLYVIKNKGEKKVLINNIPMLLSFYITFIFAGVFIFFGISIAFNIAFLGANVEGSSKTFAIIFGLFFAYFPISIIYKQLKKIIYTVLTSCIKNYN
jgi:membrane associated rhomboid family serine protease